MRLATKAIDDAKTASEAAEYIERFVAENEQTAAA